MANETESKEYQLSRSNGQIVKFKGAVVGEVDSKDVAAAVYRTEGGNFIVSQKGKERDWVSITVYKGSKAPAFVAGVIRQLYAPDPIPQEAIDLIGRVAPELKKRFIVEVE